ncbi:hypothetical protein [Couchioplanes caeruleus]|uniref:hypothetical protein n=1 Tax=Couchioplanes caeruleus TaxID=56438 RepID=UPI001476CD3F|nr:hypothetical protein [Couchioplanes caeruleus]
MELSEWVGLATAALGAVAAVAQMAVTVLQQKRDRRTPTRDEHEERPRKLDDANRDHQ